MSNQKNIDRASGSYRRALSLFDCVAIIIGVIVGAGIFETTPAIAQSVGGPWGLMGVWITGGFLSLIGALCYAELATAYPREGGEYVYLTRAFGRSVGFMLAWAWFWVVRPGSIGAMAFIFARYVESLVPIGDRNYGMVAYAAGSVVVLTAINIIGIRGAKWTQNALTAAKVIGLLAIFAVVWRASPPPVEPDAIPENTGPNLALAMILTLFTFGGWNDISYVAAEVRDPRRNMTRALLLGVVAVTVIYLLVNIAFLAALGFEGVAGSSAVAAETMSSAIGRPGAVFISVLICVSCLGATHGMLLTGARVYSAFGADHRAFRWLGVWNPRLGTPARSLTLQAAITIALIVAFGSESDGFERMVVFTGPLFFTFMTLVGIALFVLRRADSDTERPFRVPLYPITPLLFCASSVFMLQASFRYALQQQYDEAWWAIGAMAVGALMCFAGSRRGRDC